MKTEVSKRIKKDLERNLYGPLDTVEVCISFESFVDSGMVICRESIKKLKEEIIRCMKLGKHPTLNPVFDKLAKYKEEEDPMSSFIEAESKFETHDADDQRDILVIESKIELLSINVRPFLESELLSMKEAVVQTPLFKKEYK